MILRAAVRPTAETLALAASVRRQARVAVLTNNNLLVKRAADTVFPELRPIFGPNFFVSGEFHARKPEPEAYLRCLAHVGAAAEATLFVDDSARNVAGAERAGLQADLYRSPDGLNLRLGGFWTSDGAIHGPHFIEAAPFPPIAPGAVSVVNACVHVPEEKGNFELALDLFEWTPFVGPRGVEFKV